MLLWKVMQLGGGPMGDVLKRILTGLRRDDFFLAALAIVGADGDPCARYVAGRSMMA